VDADTCPVGGAARRVTFVGIASMLLSACASTSGLYAPRSPFPIDQDIAELHDQFGSAASIKGYYAGAATVERRNEFIAGRLVLYDLEYIRFVSRFRIGRAGEAAAFDALALGVGFATTITTGERVKTILGAVTTALTGARTSYEKNFYEDKTADALLAAMNAQRKQALVAIIAGSKASLADYSLTQAVADLSAYQHAGTLDGALEGIQGDASAKVQAATNAIDRLRKISYGPDDASARIVKWLYPTAATVASGVGLDASGKPVNVDPARVTQLQAELKKLGLDVPIAVLLDDPGSTSTRQTVIKDLSIP
jgi:hypothetical protein